MKRKKVSQINLKEIEGKKVRWQYFSVLVILMCALIFFVSYCMLVFTIKLDEFNIRKWLSDVLTTVWICFCFSAHWIILTILNRFCFGDIVCVLTENGIFYNDGFIEWDRISRVEYIIDLPSKYRYDPNRKCRAVIYTGDDSIVLLHAPRYILRLVKKFDRQIDTGMSKGSKWLVASLVLALIFVPLLLFLI